MNIGDFLNSFYNLWIDGGLLMWPLLLITVYLYWNIFELFSIYSQINFDSERSKIIKIITKNSADQQSIHAHMTAAKKEYFSNFEIKLNFLTVLVSVPPLLGLLGTVMGMLGTFTIMNNDSTKKTDLMAGGISEALITTQMGLIISVPALLMIVSLKIKQEHLRTFFEKVEVEGIRHAFMRKGG